MTMRSTRVTTARSVLTRPRRSARTRASPCTILRAGHAQGCLLPRDRPLPARRSSHGAPLALGYLYFRTQHVRGEDR
jgi:hypothetical protein